MAIIPVKHKRSAVAGKIPTTAQLPLGEIAINTFDGKAYIKKNDGTESIVELGSGGSVTNAKGISLYNKDGSGSPAVFNGVETRFQIRDTSGNVPSILNSLSLIISLGGVIQKPNLGSPETFDGFYIASNAVAGADIIFSEAPVLNTNFFGTIGGIYASASIADLITVGDTGTVTGTIIANNTITNANISTSAAISYSKLASLTSGYVLIGNNGNVATPTAISGDVTISNTGVVTLANSGVTAGSYNNSSTSVRPFTVDSKGRITSIGNAVTITPAFSSITDKPTTLTGYGISDAATSTHIHGNITNAGAIGSTANLPIITTTSGVLTTGSFGSSANTFCQGNDARLSDTRNTTNSLTFNNNGSGSASGITFNGSSAITISYNTVGAPSTTGTNASGNWGISITGSSASCTGNSVTATTATNLSGFTNSNASSTIGGANSLTNNGIGYVNTVNLFDQTDGALYAQAYSTEWVHQIFGDYRTGQIAVRGKQNGNWQDWRTVLDSGNYGSIADSRYLRSDVDAPTIYRTGAFAPQLTMHSGGDISSGPYYIFRKTRGDNKVLIGDALGTLLWQATSQTNNLVNTNLSIAGICNSTPVDGTGYVPTRMEMQSGERFYLTMAYTGIQVEVKQNGCIGINGGTVDNEGIRIGRKLTGNDASSSGIVHYGSPDVSGDNNYFLTYPVWQANKTVGAVLHYRAAGMMPKPTGCTILNHTGFWCDDIVSGNNFTAGYYSNINIQTGLFRRNFYAEGNAPNYFNGSVGIGTPNPSAKLDVIGYTKTGNYGGEYQGITLQNNRDSSTETGVNFIDFRNNLEYAGAHIFSVHTADGRVNLSFATTNLGAVNQDRRVQRVVITGQGYLKATSNDTFTWIDGTYHEFNQDQDNVMLYNTVRNTSYTSTAEVISVTAAQSSTWHFVGYYSGSDLELKVRGDGAIFGDGAYTVGADYAEYFEWIDGNAQAEDRRGFSVVLEGNKIRMAEEGEEPIGIISSRPSVVGDSAPFSWAEKYLKDDFGDFIRENYDIIEWTEVIEDISPAAGQGESDPDLKIYKEKKHSYISTEVPEGIVVPDDAVTIRHDGNGNRLTRKKLNPAFDPELEYIDRENRIEWDAVGLMGKLRMRKGQVTGSRWIKMRDISNTVEEWLVR